MPIDIPDSVKALLGDNADEKIQAVLSGLNAASAPKESAPPSENMTGTPADTLKSSGGGANADTLKYISQIKALAEEMGSATDSRSALLMSLRPFMRAERQHGIDTAVKLLNLSKFSGLFKL